MIDRLLAFVFCIPAFLYYVVLPEVAVVFFQPVQFATHTALFVLGGLVRAIASLNGEGTTPQPNSDAVQAFDIGVQRLKARVALAQLATRIALAQIILAIGGGGGGGGDSDIDTTRQGEDQVGTLSDSEDEKTDAASIPEAPPKDALPIPEAPPLSPPRNEVNTRPRSRAFSKKRK